MRYICCWLFEDMHSDGVGEKKACYEAMILLRRYRKAGT